MKNNYKGLSKKDLMGIIHNCEEALRLSSRVPEPFKFDVDLKKDHKPTFENIQYNIEQFILDGASQEEMKRYLNNFKDTKENNMNQLEMKIKSEELECEILNLKLEQKKINIKRLQESDTSIEAQLKAMEAHHHPKQPIIIKSGDTWVAEYMGVDYLWIGHQDKEEPSFLYGEKGEVLGSYWKPISEIKITDDIAKLRPVLYASNSLIKLYGVIEDEVYSYVGISLGGIKSELFSKDHYRLATVKDLQDS